MPLAVMAGVWVGGWVAGWQLQGASSLIQGMHLMPSASSNHFRG